jgi:hypothetical protein
MSICQALTDFTAARYWRRTTTSASFSTPDRLRQETPDMPTALSISRCRMVVASYEHRGYVVMRDTLLGVALRHPNGGVITVLANGETRGGDKAGPREETPTLWWSEPVYTAPE